MAQLFAVESVPALNLDAEFEILWKQYPNRDGKKAAIKHFRATVRNSNDLAKIHAALANYKRNLYENSWKHPKNGSTWFNNWEDWIEPPDDPTEEDRNYASLDGVYSPLRERYGDHRR